MFSKGKLNGFLGPTTPNQPRSIENQMDQYQVWVTRRIYLKKKSHKTAIFPALQKLTHMRSETGILKLRPSCKFVQIGLFDTIWCSANECVTWCTLSAVRCNARQSRVWHGRLYWAVSPQSRLCATYYALTHALFSQAPYLCALYTLVPS